MKLFKRKGSGIDPKQSRYMGRPSAFSYHANRSSDTSGIGRARPVYKKPSRFSLKALPTVLAALAIVYSLGYLFTLETNPRIVVLGPEDRTSLLQDDSVYSEAAQEILENSIFNRNKLTINTDSTAEHLMNRFPELKDVVITIPIASHRPVFELEPALPTLILASANAGPFVIDAEGRAVVRTEDATSVDQLSLPHVTDESGLELVIGTPVLPQEDITFIANVYKQLKAAKLTISSMTLPPIPNELHVRLKDDKYYVKFNISGDARLQSGALLAVKKELRIKRITPRAYIDVRVKDKVFYK